MKSTPDTVRRSCPYSWTNDRMFLERDPESADHFLDKLNQPFPGRVENPTTQVLD
jgi:hypothetical protein